MVETTLASRSPLDGIVGPAGGPHDAGLVLAERRNAGKLILRGDAGPAFLAAAGGVLGAEPPTAPNTVTEINSLAMLWLSPDEWLVVTEPGAEAALLAGLRAALASLRGAAVDVTDSLVAIRVSGPRVRRVLAKGCALDLHPRAFGPGQSAQSHLAKALVTLRQVAEAPSYELYVRASFAPYLWRWLVDAGMEFGVRVDAG